MREFPKNATYFTTPAGLTDKGTLNEAYGRYYNKLTEMDYTDLYSYATG